MPSPNEYRHDSLEHDSLSRVSAGSTALSKGSVALVTLGGIGVAAWILYGGLTRQPVKNDDSDFNTTRFSPPVVTAENLQPVRQAPEIIRIEPAPKAPPAPPLASAPVALVTKGPLQPTLPQLPPQTITTPPEQIIALPPQPPVIMVQPAMPQQLALAAPGLEPVSPLDAPALPQQPPGVIQPPTFPEKGQPEAVITIEPAAPQPAKPVEDDKWVRLRADSIVSDESKEDETPEELSPADAANAAAEEPDKNLAFLEKSGNAPVKMEKAKKIERIDAMVPQGTFIKGIHETAIQSDLAGLVRAVTSEDVYSFDGRRVLIPSGTRLVGDYKSGIENGQTRVFIVWNRLLRPDGVSVQLASTGADELGRGGMPGFVDNHYAQRYGSAILLSLIGGGAQFLQNWGFGAQQAVRTISRTLPDGSVETITSDASELQAQARQAAADQIAENLTKLASDALEKNINIPPTIHVDQGTRITVFVRRDLDFSAFYEDPVIEALREIKRERKLNPDGLPQ